MSGENKIEFNELYVQLNAKIDEYRSGTISADQLKHSAAVFGIYEQRNHLFMVRVRITGGAIATATIKKLTSIIDANNVGYIHLSSRQDIQLQDVAPDKIFALLCSLDIAGLPFKGGGGNSYRNIAVSADSGFGADSIFDVQPYAAALNQFLKYYDHAFTLPRKFKIGFFSNFNETLNAAVQDLGFVAAVNGGKRGFSVFCGGGMGRESQLGVKLFDFLPEQDYIRCTVAITELFNEHGDRTNRNQARLRFVLKKLGNEAFIRLCHDYFNRTAEHAEPIPAANGTMPTGHVKLLPIPDNFDQAGFDIWRQHAVLPTSLGAEYCSVRVYVPYGDLNVAQLGALIEVAEEYGCTELRLLPSQDILLPLIHINNLPAIYHRLSGFAPDLDLTVKSFRGHILSCVGAAVCKIGILNSPDIADIIADKLDTLLPADTPNKIRLLKIVTNDLRISGCPNGCSGHHLAAIGIEGQKKRIDEILTDVGLIYSGCSANPAAPQLASTGTENQYIKVSELPDFILSRLVPLSES
jgi:sulfite reductase beta subunit-like hemoprotein